jgi:hypothetical protein
MSRDQLVALLKLAEDSPDLRHRLRFTGDWHAWLQQAHRLGFAVTATDLQQACAAESSSSFLRSSQMPAIRPLR